MKAKLGFDSLAQMSQMTTNTMHTNLGCGLTTTTLELAMQRSTELYWKQGVSIEAEVLLLGRFPYSTNFKLLKIYCTLHKVDSASCNHVFYN